MDLKPRCYSQPQKWGIPGYFLRSSASFSALTASPSRRPQRGQTSPITPTGKIVFGILLGIFTGIFRLFGGSAEGVSYAIIFCNLLVPLIERFTTPAAFGKGGKKK